MVPLSRCSKTESKVAGFALKGKYLEQCKGVKAKFVRFRRMLFFLQLMLRFAELHGVLHKNATNIAYSYDTAGCIRQSP